MKYKVAVVGGGPAGACAAEIFAQEKGIDTVLFERKLDNAKPCGGAIPLCMVGEFDLPESVVDRKVCTEKICCVESLLFWRLTFCTFLSSAGPQDESHLAQGCGGLHRKHFEAR
jgi:2-polyprenyl-6-methoxyphenol hydroxylase-like FAD-dependent oxidoreductase